MTNLKSRRLKKNITQEELSIKSHISIRSIQAYEQKTANIDACSIQTLLIFSKILDCKFTDLYEDEELKKRIEEQFEQ